MPGEKLSIAALISAVDYDPASGAMTWKHRPGASKSWNTAWAGKRAFTAKTAAGYSVSTIDGVKVYAHRAAWAITHGVWPSDCIDHVNGDMADNRIENIREATRRDNNRNMRARDDGQSKFKGVGLQSRGTAWRARIAVNGKQFFLGQFKTQEEAARAYDEAAIHHFGQFARLNFQERRA